MRRKTSEKYKTDGSQRRISKKDRREVSFVCPSREQISSNHNSIPDALLQYILAVFPPHKTQNAKAQLLGLNLHPTRNCSFVGGSACNQFREPLKIKPHEAIDTLSPSVSIQRTSWIHCRKGREIFFCETASSCN